MAMVKLGILNYEIMKNTRSHAILAIVIVAAVITPTPDAFTLLLLSGPMIVLYEICIWLAYFHKKKEREADLAEKKELESKMIAAPANTTSRDDDDDDDPDHDGPDDNGGPDTPPSGGTPPAIETDYEPPRRSYSRDIEEYFDDDDEDESDQHSDKLTDHYAYHDADEDVVHGEDEGEECDDGTYDFDDSELEEEYRPDTGTDPNEVSFYDNLDGDFEPIDSDPNTPVEQSEKETDPEKTKDKPKVKKEAKEEPKEGAGEKDS